MKLVHKLLRIYRTVRYLTVRQIFYQVYYRLIAKPSYSEYSLRIIPNTSYGGVIRFYPPKYQKLVFTNDTVAFTFLNKTNTFEERAIDWNYSGYGKLWTYHLNYFEFLSECSAEQGETLINSYIKTAFQLKDGMEPFPTSLRIINWVKFFQKFKLTNETYLKFIRSDLQNLERRLEYHLDANHLLENFCSLWIGACFFDDKPLKTRISAKYIKELKKQFFEDGLHFEQSPMYHAVLMTRLLDCYKIAEENNDVTETLYRILSKGLARLQWFTVENRIPEFNDSTNEETPDINELLWVAQECGIQLELSSATDSGYRKIENEGLVVFADYGNITPSFQPGHAHADTFNFVLYDDGKEVVVDTGISTYDVCLQRSDERSTRAHNTIEYAEKDSSEVWGSFRVGRRANVYNQEASGDGVKACHDGYSHIGAIHQRHIRRIADGIEIHDTIRETNEQMKVSRIHFHPDATIEKKQGGLVVNGKLMLTWMGVESWELNNYNHASGYHKSRVSIVWEARVSKTSTIQIKRFNR